VLLTLLVAMAPVSTDLYLPSLRGIAADLGTSEGLAQLTIGLFIAGFAAMMLVCARSPIGSAAGGPTSLRVAARTARAPKPRLPRSNAALPATPPPPNSPSARASSRDRITRL
jgi:hypothetical protein